MRRKTGFVLAGFFLTTLFAITLFSTQSAAGPIKLSYSQFTPAKTFVGVQLDDFVCCLLAHIAHIDADSNVLSRTSLGGFEAEVVKGKAGVAQPVAERIEGSRTGR